MRQRRRRSAFGLRAVLAALLTCALLSMGWQGAGATEAEPTEQAEYWDDSASATAVPTPPETTESSAPPSSAPTQSASPTPAPPAPSGVTPPASSPSPQPSAVDPVVTTPPATQTPAPAPAEVPPSAAPEVPPATTPPATTPPATTPPAADPPVVPPAPGTDGTEPVLPPAEPTVPGAEPSNPVEAPSPADPDEDGKKDDGDQPGSDEDPDGTEPDVIEKPVTEAPDIVDGAPGNDSGSGGPAAQLLVDLAWQINGRAATPEEVASLGVNGGLLISPDPNNPARVGVPQSGYEDGTEVAIKGSISTGKQCQLVSRSMIDGDGTESMTDAGLTAELDEGLNRYTIRNNLECGQSEGDLELMKTAGTPEERAPGVWTVGYDITVTNTSDDAAEPYGLQDTLDFGPGVSIISASWERTGDGPSASGIWPAPDTNRTATLAPAGTTLGFDTDRDITHTYHVEAVVSVPSGTPAADLDCRFNSGRGTGLTSSAQLNGLTAKACQPLPVRVAVEQDWNINGTHYHGGTQPKGFDSALLVPAGPGGVAKGEWGAWYAYDGGTPVSLAENLELPTGCEAAGMDGAGRVGRLKSINTVTIVAAVKCQQLLTLVKVPSAEPVHGVSPADWNLFATPRGEAAPAVAGSSGVAAEVAAGTTYNLGESPRFVGGAEFSPGRWNCELTAGTGRLVHGETSVTPGYGQQIACQVASDWHAPKLRVTTSAREPLRSEQAGDGVWDVSYEVAVQNPSVISGTSYNLMDTLDFGPGINIISAKWMLLGSDNSGEWVRPRRNPAQLLALDRAIGVMDTHVYLIDVRVRVDKEAPAAALDCFGGNRTGLANTATLERTVTARACAAIPGNGLENAGSPQ
ncbi:DUF11 domain-containing protein [Arthrobacter mangrovi]|nr:DUF11 domain-containing protein [Arthrobacter mangrovi]